MKSMKAFVVCFLLFGVLSEAQAQSLDALTGSIRDQVGTVQTGSKSIEAKIDVQAWGVLRYAFDEIDSKGNRTAYVYEFNLADIDPYAVRELTQKDAIFAVLGVRNKQKLVKVIKNQEVDPYDNEVKIIAKDIETARAITEAVKKAIPLAEKEVTSRLKISGYDAMINWLTENVKDVAVGSKTYVQSMSKGDHIGTLVFKEVTTDTKGSVEETYSFNLADLNLNTINFKVTGNRFAINVETLRKDKYVAVRKNGEVKPYVNEVTINTNNVDEARDIKTILTMAVPLAVEKVKSDIPVVNSEKDGLQNIKKQVVNLKVGSKQITQQMLAECLCKLTQTESDAKATESNVYQFNWMDFNPVTSQVDVSGDKLFIELQTIDKKKMVMHTKNDKFDGYETSVKLYLFDIESARRLKSAVDKSIEKCKGRYTEPFGNDASSAITWLKENVREVTLEDETHKQSLEHVEEGKIEKLKFTNRELNPKGTGAEEVYEFSLADVNPLSTQVDTKGKWLYVSFEAEFKNKIFKYYKDGKIQPYASKIEFAVNDVELARNVMGALKKSATLLKGK
jgi:hypothetical protein